MEIVVNGDRKSIESGLTLAQYIEQSGMKGDRVAVERNREIVPRALWNMTHLQDGDQLEVVHFVGGGSMN